MTMTNDVATKIVLNGAGPGPDEIAKLARFPASNPHPVLRASPEGAIRYANPAGNALLDAWNLALGDRLPEPWPGLIAMAMEGDELYPHETTIGQQRWSIDLTAVPQDSCVYLYGQDVTQQWETEAQLRQSQKLEAVGRLAGGIAHDFNNWLQVINGFSDLLVQRLEDDEEGRRYAERIRDAGNRGATLVAQLLTFGRRQELHPTLERVDEVVDELSELLQRLLGPEVALDVRHEQRAEPVLLDRNLFEQALMNLAVNARDAMPRGGRLRIATGNRVCLLHPAGMEASTVVRVSDDGAGMDDTTRLRIFEPFFTTKRAGEGTGLGLSMVDGFVAQSGGHIAVESAIGQGTTFEIALPWPERRRAAGPTPAALADRTARRRGV